MNEYANLTEKQFEELLHQQIPITKEMALSIEEYNPRKVRIGVKVSPNLNFKSAAFGGSINSAMTVCGWALVLSNMLKLDPDVKVVLQKSSIEYIKPIKADFTAQCELINNEKRERFFKTYEKVGKARLELHVLIKDNQEVLARFRGLYVAVK